MSEDKNIKNVLSSFSESGTIGKILFTFVVIFILFFAVFVWYNIQNTKMIGEFVKQNRNVETLIKTQAKNDVFKECVKKAYDTAEKQFNNELLVTLGETMQKNGVAFPQDLNKAILKYREVFAIIKDCLIFPEKL